jgi:hypothetical protein
LYSDIVWQQNAHKKAFVIIDNPQLIEKDINFMQSNGFALAKQYTEEA